MISLINKNTVHTIESLNNEFFKDMNWYYKKRKVKLLVDDSSLVIESKNKGVNYLTLFENNTNFSNAKKQLLEFEKSNLIEIKGRQSGNIKVIIYLIEYDKKLKRLNTNRFKLNERVVIEPKPFTKYARLAIRIEGEGELHITKFVASKVDNGLNAVDTLPREMQDIRMACIFDEFSMQSFKDIVTLITFTPHDWRTVLEKDKPDVLMVESAWKGNKGAWQYEVASYNNNSGNRKLKQLIMWCKKNKIPTVFWNKEDPIHFKKFINTAALFDYVFTTDSDKISDYKKHLNHSRVYSLQFAANPSIHNPTTYKEEKKNLISFAGSYYANRHPDRKKDMEDLLSIAKEFGLHIFDRNYQQNKRGDKPDFMFPEKFQENIIGSLKYQDIYKAYKEYRLILNVNSVKFSPTMFSRRVFEGLACGTPIISSYSVGIKKTFNNIVTINESSSEFRNEISQLMTDTFFYRKRAMQGMRLIFNNHTYKHRAEYILDIININYQQIKDDVTIIFCISSNIELSKAKEIINKQTFKNMKIIFLLDLFEGYESVINHYNNGIYSAYLKSYAEKYEGLGEIVSTRYLTIMDIRNSYGENYIEDLVHACIYSDADIVGKKSIQEDENYNYSKYEYQFVDSICEETALFKVSSIYTFHLQEVLHNRDLLIKRLFKQEGMSIYSGDKFSFSSHVNKTKELKE